MGMAVKGATQHRLVARGMAKLLEDPLLDPNYRETCVLLQKRAELGLTRISDRKRKRAEPRGAKRRVDLDSIQSGAIRDTDDACHDS